ncbi:MAG: transporter substrate-binding domain-containing protein, partial [Coriobacteriales bacterium]|nr:transporter substrate-binding domain-containing protein [Coriobacteriales bacterium]
MKVWRRKGMAVLSATLIAALLGLTGCFSPSIEGSLKLPEPVIAAPDIVQDGTLRVGVDSSRAPFAGLSEGRLIGIDVDYAAALAENMGLRLEVIDIKGQDATATLEGGTVDVIMGIQDEAANSFGGAQVGPYLVDGPAIFALGPPGGEPIDLASLSGASIAAQEGSLSAWQVGEDYGDARLVTHPSLNAVFDELSAGAVPYAAADAVVGSFLALQYENIRCEGLLAGAQGV